MYKELLTSLWPEFAFGKLTLWLLVAMLEKKGFTNRNCITTEYPLTR